MTLNEGERGFSQPFVEAVRTEINKKYETACEMYLWEADNLQRKEDLRGAALCLLLASRCKAQTQKGAKEEFGKAATVYLEIAKRKDTLPLEARLAYRCAAKCFLRAELYDRADEAQRSANSIMQEGVTGQITRPIMIIDDSKVVTLKLKKYVMQFGSQNIVICNNGREGIEKFKELTKNGQLPVVLLDMGMPDIAGNEVAAQMLKIQQDTTIALITADSIDSDRVKEALANGVGYFLQKPFRYDEIKELLETIQYEEHIA